VIAGRSSRPAFDTTGLLLLEERINAGEIDTYCITRQLKNLHEVPRNYEV
jgi:hypothetical protein